MVFNEKSLEDGQYAADENNERNAARGAHVESGGKVTPGVATGSVELNVESVDIRVDGAGHSNASDTATLPANSTAYPRRDLVYASAEANGAASIQTLVGEPIDAGAMETLVAEGVLGEQGQPKFDAESIPEVQPPAFEGYRTAGTLLAMVFVPPATADSADISDSLITDLRREGIGVSDVLRQGDALEEIEEYDTAANGPVRTRVVASDRFGERTRAQQALTANVREQRFRIDPNSEESISFFVPAEYNFQLWALGIVVGVEGPGTGDVTPQRFDGGGWENVTDPVTDQLDRPASITPDADPLNDIQTSSGQLFRYRVRNTDATTRTITIQYSHTFDITSGYGYDESSGGS